MRSQDISLCTIC